MEEKEETTRLGKFELLELLEEGPGGKLWRARDTEEDRSVALKVFPDALSRNSSFGRYLYDTWSDQQTLMEHPNVLRVWETGETSGTCWVAVEKTEGRPLSAVLGEAPLDPDDCLGIIHQTAEGLRAIHRRDVLHGHLKPADVFLTRDKMGDRLVKVSLFDMGVSASQSMQSVFGETLGTPKYMAPEVIQGNMPGPEADIFSLGVIAYELLTGREPFPSQHAVGYLFANCQKELTPADQALEGVPHELALVVGRMLERDPSLRYRSIQRVVDDLDRCVQSIKTGQVEHVPYGTDSAFARQYELTAPERRGGGDAASRLARPAVLTGLTAGVVALLAAVGIVGYVLGRPADETRPVAMGTVGNEPARGSPARSASRPEPGPEQLPEPAAAGEEESAKWAFDRAMTDWRRYSEREQYDLGIAAFADVAESYPGTAYAAEARRQMARVNLEWADALSREGDHADALEKYKSAAQQAAEDSRLARLARAKIPSAMAGMAENARKRGHYREALERYREIAEQYPGSPEARLLERKKPALLFNRSSVLRDEEQYPAALDVLLQLIKDYAGTEWAERARKALPDVYLLSAEQQLAAGELTAARERIRRLIETYPDSEAAGRAAEVDSTTLYGLYSRARQKGRTEEAREYYGQLLSLYPNSTGTVQALRAELGLRRPAGQAQFTAGTAQSQLRKAQARYEEEDFDAALNILRTMLQFAPPDSAPAREAAKLLPRWKYHQALRACGKGAGKECENILAEVSRQFPASKWAKRAETTRNRLKNPPAGMVYVPEGPFAMGTDLEDIARIIQESKLSALGGNREATELLAVAYGFSSEVPRHTATTDAFYIDKTEVTNQEYKKFLDETGHAPPPNWSDGTYPSGQDNHPVAGITLSDARAYSEWRGARLPTEKEWEKAARGVDGRRYPWGDRFDKQRCHHMRPEDAGPVPVGSFPAWDSPYGCLDVIGNVMEWTTSAFEPYPGNKLEMPAGQGAAVVRRGGAWRQEELADIPTRCASRYPAAPQAADSLTGLRCVVEPEDTEETQ